MKKWRPIIALLLSPALLLSACGQQGDYFMIMPRGQAFQGAVTLNKVDILWVIDNSGSMLTKQQNLANSFASFMQVFEDKNFDFHMAIVTTDTNPTPGGQAGEFQGAPTVLTNSTANYQTAFQTNVVAGFLGDASAKPLDAIALSLSDALTATTNSGFLREDAHLAVIVLTDADDNNSAASVASTIAFLEALKPAELDSATGREKEKFSVSAVIDDQTNPGSNPCVGSEDGIKLREIANSTHGQIADICALDFSQGLVNLSTGIAQFTTQVKLAQAPQVATLQVTFGGAVVPQNSVNGWTYDSVETRILFHGTYIPDNNTSINVTYTPNDIIR